jgi:hypothetical protein
MVVPGRHDTRDLPNGFCISVSFEALLEIKYVLGVGNNANFKFGAGILQGIQDFRIGTN